MDAKALELYKQYLIERLGLIFDEEATDSKEYDNKMRKYIEFLPPKKEEKVKSDDTTDVSTPHNNEKKVETVSKKTLADSKEKKVKEKKKRIVNYNGLYYIEHPDGSRKPLNPNIAKAIDFRFHAGVAIVKNNRGRYNLIDTNGEILLSEWSRRIKRVCESLYLVESDSSYYALFDSSHKIIIDYVVWVDKFHNGVAKVRRKNYSYNFINIKGEILLSKWFRHIGELCEGLYKCIDLDERYYIVNSSFKVVYSNLDKIYEFKEGFAVIKYKGKYNYINSHGNLISQEWFDYAGDFHFRHAIIKSNGKWKYINTDGKIVSPIWFDRVGEFTDGLRLVVVGDKYNYANTEGKVISPVWFDQVSKFTDGLCLVAVRDKYNYINTDGVLASKEWYKSIFNGRFDEIEYLKLYEIFLVKTDGYMYIIDTDGNMISLNNWITERDVRKGMVKSYPNFFDIAGTVKCKKIDMGKYQVKKVLGGYKCDDGVSGFKVKYEPIKKFGFRYTLCFNNGTHELYLHDRAGNHYIQLGSYRNIVYDDYFIIDNKHKKIYLIYANTFTDITEYYLANLADKEKLKITMGCESLMTFDEFCASNLSKILEQHEKEQTDIRMARQRANLEEEKLKQEQIEKEKLAKMEAEKLKDKKQKEESDEKQKEALEMLKSALLVLSQVQDGKIERVRFDNIFVQVGDHLEIASVFRTSLKFIDLSQIDFANVDIHGVDFSGCNLGMFFDPQKVYNKDLRGCNFEKVYFSPFIDFAGVDIRGCRFSDDDDPRTIDYFRFEDIFHSKFSGAIYDKTTTYNGIPFTELIKETRGSGTSRATG